MFRQIALAALCFLSITRAQQVGKEVTETHPKLPWQKCTRSGCTTQSNGQVVLDANWRWLHVTDGYTNCYTGNTWNTSICTNGATCAQKCALEGANYQKTYGITVSGNALTLKFVTKDSGTNIGSRVYLMESDTKYAMFNLLNQEFTFDVDVSKLPCGLNGALYFIQMDSDGGLSKYSGNKAGAKYGTGYCDSQCPKDMKFIAGEVSRPSTAWRYLWPTSAFRLTVWAGLLPPTTPTLETDNTVPAVRRWISGRPTPLPRHTPLTHARLTTMADTTAAVALSVTLRRSDTTASATLTVVTSIRIA
jgi:Glycosyl hydrolase family 7